MAKLIFVPSDEMVSFVPPPSAMPLQVYSRDGITNLHVHVPVVSPCITSTNNMIDPYRWRMPFAKHGDYVYIQETIATRSTTFMNLSIVFWDAKDVETWVVANCKEDVFLQNCQGNWRLVATCDDDSILIGNIQKTGKKKHQIEIQCSSGPDIKLVEDWVKENVTCEHEISRHSNVVTCIIRDRNMAIMTRLRFSGMITEGVLEED